MMEYYSTKCTIYSQRGVEESPLQRVCRYKNYRSGKGIWIFPCKTVLWIQKHYLSVYVKLSQRQMNLRVKIGYSNVHSKAWKMNTTRFCV